MFHSQQQHERVFCIINSTGESELIRKWGTFALTSHNNIINQLQLRHPKFQQLKQSAAGVTDNQPACPSCHDSPESLDASHACEQAEVDAAIRSDLLQVHGAPPNTKQHGITWLCYENYNSISPTMSNNAKVEKHIKLHNDLDLDIVAGTEHHQNLWHKDNKHGFKQLFQRETKLECIAAHNIHENVGRILEGGTSLLLRMTPSPASWIKIIVAKIRRDLGDGHSCDSRALTVATLGSYQPTTHATTIRKNPIQSTSSIADISFKRSTT